MNCRTARNLMTPGASSPAEPALARHLASCAECARLAERWAAVGAQLRQRRAVVTPDAGFAARVTARLEAPADPLVWAARRLVPVTLALTLALGGWCLLRTPTPTTLAAELADVDLLTWVASGTEESR
jgi:anti-sigma factor RsiW